MPPRAPTLLSAVPYGINYICTPCRQRLASPTFRQLRATSSQTTPSPGLLSSSSNGLFQRQYFLSNNSWDRSASSQPRSSWLRWIVEKSNPLKPTSSRILKATPAQEEAVRSPGKDATLPHRRRRRKHRNGQSQEEYPIPLDASSQLSAISSQHPATSLRQRFFAYLALSKPRLTFLMVLTTTTAYSLFPVAVSPMSSSLNLSPLTLLNLTTGTALASACANTLNMYLEPAHDAKMSRTRSRPLVRGLLTPRAALAFAAITGATGVGLLHFGVNPTVAFLSALNIFLYAGVYTPLKRISVINTWVGAIVGGIPPLMGWAAAAHQASTITEPGWRDLLFDPATSVGGWLIAGLLFAWQFPHFNAIAYSIRHEYANAGYRMLASFNPRKNALIALRYSIVMFPICVGLSYVGITGWGFVATSGVVNGWMLKEAWRFWKFEGEKGSARGLFWASVWQLPLILVLAMVHKKGLWERFIKGGLDDEDFEEYLAEEDAEQPGKSVAIPAKP